MPLFYPKVNLSILTVIAKTPSKELFKVLTIHTENKYQAVIQMCEFIFVGEVSLFLSKIHKKLKSRLWILW